MHCKWLFISDISAIQLREKRKKAFHFHHVSKAGILQAFWLTLDALSQTPCCILLSLQIIQNLT